MATDNLCPICESPVKVVGTKPLQTEKDILRYLDHFRDKKQEYFICLSLDSGQRLITWRVVTIGTLDMAIAHPREIFAGPIADRAASIIIAHNHPSGMASPSSEDIKTTQQIVAAGLILGIRLRDHLIVTENAHFSFRNHAML
jgi:DNA repair protein RadC